MAVAPDAEDLEWRQQVSRGALWLPITLVASVFLPALLVALFPYVLKFRRAMRVVEVEWWLDQPSLPSEEWHCSVVSGDERLALYSPEREVEYLLRQKEGFTWLHGEGYVVAAEALAQHLATRLPSAFERAERWQQPSASE